MDKQKYIIPVLLLLLGACSSDEGWNPLPDKEPSAVEFRAGVGEGENAEFESDYFKEGNQIRIFCPISYSTPNFEDDAPGTYVYTYSKTQDGDYPYKFREVKEGQGFDWRTLVPTSLYYVFEAMYFPGNRYLEEVPTNQNEPGMLERADMLIAHHRQLWTERGLPVKLTFHHAFAMVEIRVKIPVSDSPVEGPFPRDAIKDVYMRAMLTSYEVNYSQVISNDGLRTVRASETEENQDPETPDLRKNVHMRQKSTNFTTKTVGSKTIEYQEYVFQGIVPAQKFLAQGSDFIYFKVQKHDGGDPKIFKYVPETPSLSLISSHVLNLSLEINPELQDVVVFTAEIEPWGKAGGNMEIGPTDRYEK